MADDVFASDRPVDLAATFELPPPSAAELRALRESIAADGVLQPVVASAGPARLGEIADGRSRLSICSELGIACPHEERPFASEAAFTHFRLTTNLVRRELSIAERIRFGMALEPFERELASQRRAQAKGGRRGEKSLPVAVPEEKGETRELVARRVGLKATTYERGAKVLSEGSPELVARLLADDETVTSAYRRLQEELKRDERRALAQALRENPPPPPNGRYTVVVVDPPWPLAGVPYPTMPLEEIAALPLPDLLTEDAVVWLWTTNGFLEHAIAIATERWGLVKRQVVTWDKERPGRPTPWLTGQTEPCILLTRGKPVFEAGNATNLIRERTREHSRKPEAFYELVEKTCAARPRLEMFARERRAGFEPWGAEVDFFPSRKEPS
jgi:N6-adenosine-specific RNA methylase IME4/ParB-like chromosome segregation protein Spo0J